MTNIFISYRREDSLDIAGRIYDRLAAHFGRDAVFIDVDTIPYGTDFRRYLADWVARCDVLLVVIGPRWLDATHTSGPKAGTRRLDDPADFVRIEITAALARDIPVVPVLVGGAAMPTVESLPADLSDLVFRNAAEVKSGRDFHTHMDRLIQGLERVSARSSEATPPPLPTVPRPKPQPEAPPPQGREAVSSPLVVEQPTNLGFEGPLRGVVPSGWFNGMGFVGSVSDTYEIAVLPREGHAGGRCVRLHGGGWRSPDEFGVLMQRCPARDFVGKTVRFAGDLRTEKLHAWAGLWLRLDDASAVHLFFDNMSDRPIRGSTPWTRYQIETTVPPGAVWMNYGLLLLQNGTVWADNFTLETI